jgi:hypothetical protein
MEVEMKNNTNYFSHDYNASNDFKILLMRNKLGIKGYGMFWFLIERLAEAGGKLPTEMIPIYAQQMDVEEREVHNLVNDFKLFEFAENQFFSERLLRHLEMREQDKNNKSKAGKKSAETRLQNSVSTEIQQTFNTCSTPVQQRKENKEKKIKEIKESKEINRDIVLSFFSENFLKFWNDWKKYKKDQFNFTFKSTSTEQTSLNQLQTLSNGNEHTASKIIEQSIANGWKGFFALKSESNDRDADRIEYWNNLVENFGTEEEKKSRRIERP